jgi:hypothetical protein
MNHAWESRQEDRRRANLTINCLVIRPIISEPFPRATMEMFWCLVNCLRTTWSPRRCDRREWGLAFDAHCILQRLESEESQEWSHLRAVNSLNELRPKNITNVMQRQEAVINWQNWVMLRLRIWISPEYAPKRALGNKCIQETKYAKPKWYISLNTQASPAWYATLRGTRAWGTWPSNWAVGTTTFLGTLSGETNPQPYMILASFWAQIDRQILLYKRLLYKRWNFRNLGQGGSRSEIPVLRPLTVLYPQTMQVGIFNHLNPCDLLLSRV